MRDSQAHQSSLTISKNCGKKVLKEQGNIHINELKQIIVSPVTGKPDLLAIDLYSEGRSWFKPKATRKDGNIIYSSKLVGRGWKTSYDFLQKKYCCSKETIRKKFVLLEDLGLVSRDFSCEFAHGRNYNNCLNILVWKDTPYFYSEIGLEKIQATPQNLGSLPKKSGGSSQENLDIIYSNTNNLTKEIEDSSIRAISSISEKEKNKKEKEIGDESLSSLLVLEAANQTSDLRVGLETESGAIERSVRTNAATQTKPPSILENSSVKKSAQPCAKIIPLNAEAERELQKRRLHRIGDSRPRDDQNFTLLGELLKGIELLQAPPELPKAVMPSTDDAVLSEHSANTALSLSNQGAESIQTTPSISTTSTELTTTKEENDTMAVPLKPTASNLWNTIMQEALASLEHEVDRWDLKFNFNNLEVTEDTENSRFEIRGSKSVITNMHKHHYKAFTKAFYKITTNHKFEFVKALK